MSRVEWNLTRIVLGVAGALIVVQAAGQQDVFWRTALAGVGCAVLLVLAFTMFEPVGGRGAARSHRSGVGRGGSDA